VLHALHAGLMIMASRTQACKMPGLAANQLPQPREASLIQSMAMAGYRYMFALVYRLFLGSKHRTRNNTVHQGRNANASNQFQPATASQTLLLPVGQAHEVKGTTSTIGCVAAAAGRLDLLPPEIPGINTDRLYNTARPDATDRPYPPQRNILKQQRGSKTVELYSRLVARPWQVANPKPLIL
jgi:hypothetical protein